MILVLEGLDGSGKTSVRDALAERLAKATPQTGLRAAKVAFPNRASPTGRLIDQYLRSTAEHDPESAYAHQALQVVNRLECLPELLRDDWVTVTSRYTPSAMVYGQLDGCDEAWLERITAALPPADLCVLLACDPGVALARMRARGVTADQYERRGLDWYARGAALYDAYWARQPMSGVRHDEAGTVWLRLRADLDDDTPTRLAERLMRMITSLFRCSCGKFHNAHRTPCATVEEGR